jgi:hypothetical protein
MELRKFLATSYKEYLYDNKLNEIILNKILYHGSYSKNLTKLKPFSNKAGTIPPSIFLTTKKSVAKDYGDIIYKCKIKIFNIKEIDIYGNSFHDYTSFENDIYDAYNNGYDCIVFKNIMDSKEPNTKVPLSDIYVVFDSDNILILEQI